MTATAFVGLLLTPPFALAEGVPAALDLRRLVGLTVVGLAVVAFGLGSASSGAPVEHELVVKKSRFVTRVAPVRTVAEADAVIAAVRKNYWDAGHHCVALVVGLHADQQRSSHDATLAAASGGRLTAERGATVVMERQQAW